MLIYASERMIRRVFINAVLFLCIIGGVFYGLQNNSNLPGGGIALVKLFWLAEVILCWYVIPILLFFDARFLNFRAVLLLFLINMFLRAVIELWMMYISVNWHPHYGIAHDSFTLCLSLFLAFYLRQKKNLLAVYFFIIALLFLIEAGFAWYMLNNVQSNGTPVYFVPNAQQHETILLTTQGVVISVIIFLLVFVRKWLYDSSPKR